MNQLDLILENIRLGQIEKLYQEAETDLELIRGQRLINESMLQVRGALLQEDAVMDGLTNRRGQEQAAANEAARVQGIQDQYRAERNFASRLPYGAQEFLGDPVGNTRAAINNGVQSAVGYGARNSRTLIPAGVGAAVGAGLGYAGEDGDLGDAAMGAGAGLAAGAGLGIAGQGVLAARNATKGMGGYTGIGGYKGMVPFAKAGMQNATSNLKFR